MNETSIIPDIGEARQLQQSGQLQEAEAACRTLLEATPESQQINVLLALILSQLQRFDEAKELAELSITPESGLCASDLGLLSILRGEPGRAAELLEFASKQPDMDYVVLARLGSVKLLEGDLAGAESVLREALDRSPDHPAILNNLGGALMRQDKAEEALLAYESALRLDPQLVTAQTGKSAALLLLDRAAELLLELDEQLEKEPDSIELRDKKIQVLNLEERFEEARDVLRELILEKPDEVSYPLQLANSHAREEQYQMVLKEIKAAEVNFPDNIALLNSKARACKEMGKNEKALAAVERALELEPDAAHSLVTRAMVLADADDYEGAEKDLRKALETHPGLGEAWSLLGHTLMWKGRIDEAIKSFERAAAINPGAFAALVEARAIPDDPAVIGHMKRFAGHRFIPREARSSMNFALIKVFENAGDYKNAFSHANEANHLQHEMLKYKPETHSAETDKIIETFTPELFQQFEGLGNYSERPVFVVGMPRSGTTLTEQIIASHKEAFGAGELGVINAITRLMPRVLKTSQRYPACMQKATARMIEHGGEYYLNALLKRDTRAKRVVDKLPHNFMHLGLIYLLFPYARIIHVKRDPRDIAISNYFTNFKMKRGGMGYAFDLAEIGHMINDYQRIMTHWRKVLPTTMYEYNYEDMVAEPEKYEKQLIDFVGLEWSADILDFYETDRPVRTASVWQVRQPIYKSSKERWRHYAEFLEPLMTVLKNGVNDGP